ncbi:Mitochondrial distribution and morphology protein 12 [Microbotryomycetes sp. JL221]|nr:Mitochondrial distribution and morphology protein 12 [Microbotryomycetes sp. JL221]
MDAASSTSNGVSAFESFPTYHHDNEQETLGSKLKRFFLPVSSNAAGTSALPSSTSHNRDPSSNLNQTHGIGLPRIDTGSTTESIAGSLDGQADRDNEKPDDEESDREQPTRGFDSERHSRSSSIARPITAKPSATSTSSVTAGTTNNGTMEGSKAAMALTSAVAKHDAATRSRSRGTVHQPLTSETNSGSNLASGVPGHVPRTNPLNVSVSGRSTYGEARHTPSEAFGPVGGLYGSPSAGDSFTLANLSSIPGFPLQTEAQDDSRSVRSMSTTAKTSPSVIHVFRKLRGEGLSMDYWIKDESSRECFDCQAIFTAFRRKHHSRFGRTGYIRVCNLCLSVLEHETKPPEGPTARRFAASPLRISAPLETFARGPARQIMTHDMGSIWEADSRGQTPISEAGSDVDGDSQKQQLSPYDINEHSHGVNEEEQRLMTRSGRAPSTAIAPFRRSLAEEDKQNEPDPLELLSPTEGVADDDVERPQNSALDVSQRAMSSIKPVETVTSAATAAVHRFPSGTSSHVVSDQERALSRLSSYVNTHSSSGGGGIVATRDSNEQGSQTPLPWRDADVNDVGFQSGFDRDWISNEKALYEGRAKQNRLPLTQQAIKHLRKMLRQSLEHAHVPNPKLWTRVLTPLLLHVADDLVPDLGVRGNIDVREYIRIKKMPGGRPRDSEYIEGVVFTKNLMHKHMKRHLINPRIMLLTFPLEWQRVENNLTSLDTLLKQEREYLHNLLQRIVAQRPHIILVERNVSRLALEFLLDNGIAVARNVKREAIESVARATQADIISSIDKLALEPRLGRCGVFRVQTFQHPAIPGGRKTLLRFDGCAKDLCCTLLLRGDTVPELVKVKKIVDMMTLIAYNAKLESYLFRDETLSIPTDDTSGQTGTYIRPLLADLDLSEQERISEDVSDALRPYQQTALSGSSFVHFPPPYPLARMSEEHTRVVALRRLREHEETEKILMEEAESHRAMSTSSSSISLTSLTQEHPPPGEVAQAPSTAATSTNELESSTITLGSLTEPTSKPAEDPLNVLQTPQELAESTRFAEAERQHAEQLAIWDAYMTNRRDSLNPLDHQRIYVLESKVLMGHGEQSKMCQPPMIKTITFYGDNDMALGRWIGDACETAAWACQTQAGCGRSAYEHSKILVHGQYRMVLRMLRQQDRHYSMVGSSDDAIWMRSQCKVCGYASHESPMSAETYRFSFGKYLELSFYAGRQSLMRTDGPCVHNGHVDHKRYFRIGNSILEVSMDLIDLRSVVAPPRRLRIKPERQLQLRNEEYVAVLSKSNAFWDSIMRRISTFTYDHVQAERIEECKQALAELSNKCEADRRAIVKLLKSTYEHAQATNGTEMTTVRRTLQNKAVDWEAEWSAFEQKLVPTEKDVRRLTATQLKRLFSADGLPLSPERERRIASPGLETSHEAEEKDSQTGSPQKLLVVDDETCPTMTGLSTSASRTSLAALELPPPVISTTSPIEEQATAEISGADSDSTVCADTTPVNTHAKQPSPYHQRRQQADDTSGAESEWAPPAMPSRKQSRHQATSVAQLVDFFQEGAISSSQQHSKIGEPPARSPTSGNSRLAIPAPSSRPSLRRGVTDGKARPRLRTAPKEVLSDGDGSYARNVGVSHLSRKKSFADKPSRIPAPKTFAKAESLQMMFERGGIRASSSSRSRPTSRGPTRPGSPRSTSPRATFANKLTHSPPDSRSSSRPPSRAGCPAPPRQSFSRTSSLEGTALQAKPSRPSLSGTSSNWTSRTSVRSRGRDVIKRDADSSEGPSSKANAKDVGGSKPSLSGTISKAARRVVSATSNHRVSTIANHFNRLSKATERERQKRFVMMRSKRARPVVSAQPTIQVFDNVKDAAKEESDDEGHAQSSDGADDEDDDEHDVDSEAETQQPTRPTDIASTSVESSDHQARSSGSRQQTDERLKSPRPAISMADALIWPPLEAILPVTDSTREEVPQDDVKPEPSSSSKAEPSSSDAPSVPPSPLLTDTFNTLPRMSEGESSGNERGSIMKALSNLWAYRGPELAPLEYPLGASEHIFADNPILVRDDEPTSILAFALSSKAYRNKLEEQTVMTHPARIVERSEAFMPDESLLGDKSTWGLVDVAQFQEAATDNEEALRKPEGKHFRLQFEEGSTTFFCKIFFAEQFDALRRNCGCSSQYIESLARCIQWESSGGKSKVNFLKTKDDRFIVKEISRLEMDALLRFAPAYFEYMSKAIFHGLPTILAKIFGFYRLGLRNPTTGKVMRLDVLVMENLFYERHLSQVFDLKGSTRNRKVTVSPDKPNEVLMDENLLQMANTNPLYVREDSKRLLKVAIYNDTLFLSNLNVMDYSLVVGVDSVKQELVVGIVDFIRTYTWDKRLENWVKDLGGGSSKAGGPTIITPKQYKQRFREAMEGYFLLSPDAWIAESSLKPIACNSSTKEETFATADLQPIAIADQPTFKTV